MEVNIFFAGLTCMLTFVIFSLQVLMEDKDLTWNYKLRRDHYCMPFKILVLVPWNCDCLAKHHQSLSWTTLHNIQHIPHHLGQPTSGGYHLQIVTLVAKKIILNNKMVKKIDKIIDVLPNLSKCEDFEEWKRDVKIWQAATELKEKEKEPLLYRSLEEQAKKACSNIAVKDICDKDGW